MAKLILSLHKMIVAFFLKEKEREKKKDRETLFMFIELKTQQQGNLFHFSYSICFSLLDRE